MGEYEEGQRRTREQSSILTLLFICEPTLKSSTLSIESARNNSRSEGFLPHADIDHFSTHFNGQARRRKSGATLLPRTGFPHPFDCGFLLLSRNVSPHRALERRLKPTDFPIRPLSVRLDEKTLPRAGGSDPSRTVHNSRGHSRCHARNKLTQKTHKIEGEAQSGGVGCVTTMSEHLIWTMITPGFKKKKSPSFGRLTVRASFKVRSAFNQAGILRLSSYFARAVQTSATTALGLSYNSCLGKPSAEL